MPGPRVALDEVLDDRSVSSVHQGTKLGTGWHATVYPQVGEAVAVWRGCGRPSGEPRPRDPEDNRRRAGRRVRSQVRRYAIANGLSTLVTLTYGAASGPRAKSHAQVMADTAEFVRKLRGEYGRFAEVHTAEPHKDGEHWHGHMAVGIYIPHARLRALWGHGHVHIKRFTNRKSVKYGGGKGAAVRAAAGYVAKYVVKSYGYEGAAAAGRHRYEVAEGFQPSSVAVWAMTDRGVLGKCCRVFGTGPAETWSSQQSENWEGPPIRIWSWEVSGDDRKGDSG